MDKKKVINMGGEDLKVEDLSKAFKISAPTHDVFNGRMDVSVLEAVNQVDPPKTNQDDTNGLNQENYQILPHPVAYTNILALKDISTHHAACIQAKKYSTVGLGFFGQDEIIESDVSMEELQGQIQSAQENTSVREIVSILTGNQKVNSKVDDELDPLTYFGFQNELTVMCEDLMDGGVGYLEVVRDNDDTITGIRHVPMYQLWPAIQGNNLFYKYQSTSGNSEFMAFFGRKDWLMNNYPSGGSTAPKSRSEVSEIIPFILPSNRVKFYGFPDWLSASVDIDLTAASKQYKMDFYKNRGVLDYIAAIVGGTLNKDEWETFKGMVNGSAGAGKNFRGGAMQISSKEAKLQVEKLAMESNTEEQFKVDNEVLSQNIVSAHRVPPLLANILIPGKLGATNEFVNALIGFQLLVIGPYQQIIQSQLGRTLGNSDLNGGLDLGPDDFRLRTITSQINITGLDAISRSRSEANDGNQNADRDYEEGVKE